MKRYKAKDALGINDSIHYCQCGHRNTSHYRGSGLFMRCLTCDCKRFVFRNHPSNRDERQRWTKTVYMGPTLGKLYDEFKTATEEEVGKAIGDSEAMRALMSAGFVAMKMIKAPDDKY